MKTWKDLSGIEVPARVAALPVDDRGYPVPHSVKWIEGKPDFRVIDPVKWHAAIKHRCCGLCGQPLGVRMAFVGGDKSIANRLFVDLPMHRDCAIYALQACPFLAAPKFAFSRAIDDLAVHSAVSDDRPSRFGLGIAKAFVLGQLPSKELVLHAAEFESITWWAHGQMV